MNKNRMSAVRVVLTTLCSVWCSVIFSQSEFSSAGRKMLSEWVAGVSVSAQDVANYGIDRCFESLPIDGVMYERIKGLSYKDNCTVSLDELRYIKLLHYDANGQIAIGEMICNKKISADLLYIFRELFDAKYPIERVRLVDEYGADDNLSMINNNSSAFNFRFISGTKRLSKHSLGLAVDINPLYNPYVKNIGDRVVIEPIEAQEYVDRSKAFRYKIDTSDLCYRLFSERGFEWGGSWSSLKDYQHFEKIE
ncbi:MAG: M15 family metallopeptidase [Rikenellaceae bacterium]